jgi:hypothetical protein
MCWRCRPTTAETTRWPELKSCPACDVRRTRWIRLQNLWMRRLTLRKSPAVESVRWSRAAGRWPRLRSLHPPSSIA